MTKKDNVDGRGHALEIIFRRKERLTGRNEKRRKKKQFSLHV